MCIQTRIQKILAEKEALDAQIVRLEKLESATAPVKNLLADLLADYAKEAPEDLATVWQEILAIGQQHNLSVQPLAANELRQWEATNAELEQVKQEYVALIAATATDAIEIKKLRSQLAQIQSDKPARWHRDEINSELKNLYQEALTETESEATARLADDEYDAAVESELALDDDATTAIYKEVFADSPELEYEPEKASDTVKSFLIAKSFFEPDDLEDYDTCDKHETYRGWDIYYGIPNGGIVSIGLYNEKYNQPWDASTEYIQEVDPTFPKSLADFDEIVKWTRALIDQVENLEASGQLSLEFPAATDEQINVLEGLYYDSDVAFETMGYTVKVYPQYTGKDNLAGATFRFLDTEDQLVFDSSQTANEIGELSYRVVAEQLIMNYQTKEVARLEKLANPHAKEEDKFIELVKLSPAVGYLKRRDNGELLSAYAAFANRDAGGKKTATMAKPRAKKWAEHLQGALGGCGWKVEEPRKVNRMIAEPGARQQFAYEIKITGKFSIGQLQKLAEENFSLLPNEIVSDSIVSSPTTGEISSGLIYRIKINSYEEAKGSEEEMRTRFESELEKFGGVRMSISLLLGSQIIESYRVTDFEFLHITDYDSDNPEYEVLHLPSQLKFRVWQKMATGTPQGNVDLGWTNSVYPYNNRFAKHEAAAADAVRRLLKAQNSAE